MARKQNTRNTVVGNGNYGAKPSVSWANWGRHAIQPRPGEMFLITSLIPMFGN